MLPGGEASEDVTVFVRERGVFHAVYDRWPAGTMGKALVGHALVAALAVGLIAASLLFVLPEEAEPNFVVIVTDHLS